MTTNELDTKSREGAESGANKKMTKNQNQQSEEYWKEQATKKTMDKTRETKPKILKTKLAKTNSATEEAMQQALEKDRPTLTNDYKPYENPKTRPSEPDGEN